jgi:hypothetical protein
MTDEKDLSKLLDDDQPSLAGAESSSALANHLRDRPTEQLLEYQRAARHRLQYMRTGIRTMEVLLGEGPPEPLMPGRMGEILRARSRKELATTKQQMEGHLKLGTAMLHVIEDALRGRSQGV